MASAGGGVTRTKTDVRSLMATAAESKEGIALAGDTDGGFIFPQFHPAFDALFSFAKLLELLAVQETTLGTGPRVAARNTTWRRRLSPAPGRSRAASCAS